MKTQIRTIKNVAMMAAALTLGAMGTAFAQEADPSPNTIAYWKMNQWSTNLPVGSGLTHGIADLATNVGQGTLTGGATAPASVEDLYVWGPMENNFQIVPAVPPNAMFNLGFDNGGGSWNSAHNLADGGAMFYPQDQFGNEFSSNATGGLTIEVLFKSATQSGIKQTLIWNFQGSAYTHLQLNEDGDTGSLLFWGYNGGFPTVRITAADNGTARFDDGNWHYAAMRYNAGNSNMVLTVINQDGSTVSKTNVLDAPLFPGNNPGNMLIGRTEGEGDRFNGLINQVRISKTALADSALLAAPGSAQVHVQGYWKLGGLNTVAENPDSGKGFLDLATSVGQGTLTNASYPAIPASVDNLWVLGGLGSSMTFVSTVPPVGMFNTNYPFTAGSGSWNSGADISTGGEVTFQSDVYGADMNKNDGGITMEAFFKSTSPGSATSRQTIWFNQKGNAYDILQVSEDGDTGSLLFWGYNGNFVTVRITAADNGGHRFDDGLWHYATTRYDTNTMVMSLLVVNQDGSSFEKSQTLTANLLTYNGSLGGTIDFGRDEGANNIWDGLINQIRISDQALPNKELLATTPDCVAPVIFTSPQSTPAYYGETGHFTVSAGGTLPQYQWRFNGTNLVGQTQGALNVFPVTAANAGNYDVLVSTACSGLTVTSSPAMLTVTPAVVNITRWRMESQVNPIGGGGNPISQAGINDDDTNANQGIFFGGNGPLCPATYDPLITFNDAPNPWGVGANGGVALTNTVPPTSMFINGNTGGSSSFDASFIAGVNGVVFFPQDGYGDEFDFRSSFTLELFFKSYGDQSGAGPMELLCQGTDGGNTFRYGLNLNQAGPGALTFNINNLAIAPAGPSFEDTNAGVQSVVLSNVNYADGNWHYVLAKYDSIGNAISLTVGNQDGTGKNATVALPGGYSPLGGGNQGNMFVGRYRYPNTDGALTDPRTFIGAIDEVQVSEGLVTPSSGQLGKVPSVVTPQITGISVSGGTVTIKFTGSSTDPASAFTLVGSPAVSGSYLGLSATITSLGSGNFQATIATSGATEFYRIKR
jgi:Concanavalin A-like lectin/glucanases superfamily/Laminin G domain